MKITIDLTEAEARHVFVCLSRVNLDRGITLSDEQSASNRSVRLAIEDAMEKAGEQR